MTNFSYSQIFKASPRCFYACRSTINHFSVSLRIGVEGGADYFKMTGTSLARNGYAALIT